ncbi:MAG: disulfide bond formation protein B [Alicyclobacillaceae bacterium]|nr:disulfide bond formation protein B [Alicyclobacillaceae bacterium]
MKERLRWCAALCVALAATTVSLYWSVVNRWVPCNLCWVERACMFALALLCVMGLFRPRAAQRLAAPWAAVGVAVSTYHTLLQWRAAPTPPLICSPGAPCGTPEFAYLHVVTPAFCAWVAFCSIAAVLFVPSAFRARTARPEC